MANADLVNQVGSCCLCSKQQKGGASWKTAESAATTVVCCAQCVYVWYLCSLMFKSRKKSCNVVAKTVGHHTNRAGTCPQSMNLQQPMINNWLACLSSHLTFRCPSLQQPTDDTNSAQAGQLHRVCTGGAPQQADVCGACHSYARSAQS